MITKNDLQYYSSLLKKKNRKSENKFLAEGIKSVLEGVNSNYKCEVIFVTHKFVEENEEVFKALGNVKKRIVSVKQKEFEKLSDTETPQGIAAVFVKPETGFSSGLFTDERVIAMLDNISDPGNVGTIIRNCDWFGIKNILLSGETAEYTNPKVLRASMGSVFHTGLIEINKLSVLNELKANGYEILCADTEGENIYNYRSEKKKIVIFSNEAHGPSEDVLKYADKRITIPKIGKAESLNVASASAVILAELTK
jgi:TrmH family RNA methyltransferase